MQNAVPCWRKCLYRSLPVAVVLLLALVGIPAPVQAGDSPQPVICFAAGTPQDVVAKRIRDAEAVTGRLRTSIQNGLQKFQLSNRWSVTATNGGGLTQGDPTILTWSIVPDGTSIFGYAGEPTSPSNLQADLNGIYGSPPVWLALFQQVFDHWSELTGITYVYEPNDDGSPWTQSTIAPGVLGVRGDLRIAGHTIDGTNGILAYNFFPNFGDMVIDTADNNYNNTANNSLLLRNVVAHEHGHGMGLSHVCPVNQTKLMEPFLSLAFDGPQLDDIHGAQRHYGDSFEHNDTSATATNLGAFVPGGSLQVPWRSVDDDADTNFLAFSVGASNSVSFNIQPVGATYLQGPQNPNGTCTAGTTFNSLIIHDLGIEVLDTDGTTVLAIANSNPAGQPESLSNIPLPSGAGTYFLRAFGGTTNNAQLYQFDLSVAGPVCGNGVIEAGEVCDGTDLGGQTCVSQGFSGGTLACNASCSAFDTSACFDCREGKTRGRWNQASGATNGGAAGTLFLNTTPTYFMSITLVETGATGGTFSGTLSTPTGPTISYNVAGTWTRTAANAGNFSGRILAIPSGVQVGKIAGVWGDDPSILIGGRYEGEWKICD